MNPSRPIDTNKPVAAPNGARGVGVVPAAAGEQDQRSEMIGAETLEISTAARAGTDAHRIDAQRLDALKQSVADGSYEVDPQALARRIMEDALGPEAHE